MASFDLITTVGRAYQTTWRERNYLFRMAVIPLLIKYICYALSLVYVESENIIRLSLVMLPAYFAEGWLLSHWARTIVLGHRWPFRFTGDEEKDLAQLKRRGRGVLSGTVVFTLINLLMAGYFAFFVSYIPMDMDPKEADPEVALIGIIMIISTILLFRFVWVYIAMAVNCPISAYVSKLKSLSLTFNMIGLWLVCFIPSVLLLQLSGGVLQGVGGDENTAKMMEGVIILVRVFLDLVKNLIVTAGMAYAFIEIFKWQKTKKIEK